MIHKYYRTTKSQSLLQHSIDGWIIQNLQDGIASVELLYNSTLLYSIEQPVQTQTMTNNNKQPTNNNNNNH